MQGDEEEDTKPPAILVPAPTAAAEATTAPPLLAVHGSSISEDHEQQQRHLMDMTPPTATAPAQPSSVHAEVGDEEDNWIRHADSSTAGSEMLRTAGVDILPVVPPDKPELTLKEKLVLRERQQRIETERARWKRQFARLSGTAEGDQEDDDSSSSGGGGGGTEGRNHQANDNRLTSGSATPAVHQVRVDSNLDEEDTLGEESTRAHPDEESANDEARRLGFNMERFLRNSDSFNPQLETMNEEEEKKVVMERFLNDPVVVPTAVVLDPQSGAPISIGDDVPDATDDSEPAGGVDAPVEPHRSVSFDMEGLPAGTDPIRDAIPAVSSHSAIPGSAPSFGDDMANVSYMSNVSVQAESSACGDPDVGGAVSSMGDIGGASSASLDVQRDAGSSHGDVMSTSNVDAMSSSDEPRMLRLTEADMQEMASIEDASIGNAPPSEREEEMLDEIGELADFGAGHPIIDAATATTAVESTSSHISGNQSQRSPHRTGSAVSTSSADQHEVEHGSEPHSIIDNIPHETDTSQFMVSTGAASIAANPPSEGNRDEEVDEELEKAMNVATDDDIMMQDLGIKDSADAGPAIVPVLHENFGARAPEIARSPSNGSKGGINDVEANPTIINRQRRHDIPQTPDSSGDIVDSKHIVVDGFDFDKDSPTLNFPGENGDGHDSFRDLPHAPWSAAGKMHISPLKPGNGLTVSVGSENISEVKQPVDAPVNYGSMEDHGASDLRLGTRAQQDLNNVDENTPLLDDIPPEIITHRELSDQYDEERVSQEPGKHRHHHTSTVASVFSEIRSEKEEDKIEETNESEIYLKSNILKRAFPERQFALIVTLLLEVPVLTMITGGSDALCELIGKSRYHLLIGFLPLTSAISGNVGLQASTLTTRAISHYHVTEQTYHTWWLSEVGAAVCLGIGMGAVMGAIAFVLSKWDFAFAAAIFAAQFFSILTAGITGTFAPLMFSFVFKRDSGKWGGPLETAIQDIIGSFAMIVLSYHILRAFGPSNVDPDDAC